MVDKIKFIKINGYGSNLSFSGSVALIIIQTVRITPKKIINFQLPPNIATLSEIAWPR